MNVTTSAVKLAAEGTAIYMLYWGDHYERRSNGPYVGARDLDFPSLSVDYRRDRYASANAALSDYCSLDESDFANWLVAKGFLANLEATDVEVEISSSFDDAYIPLHWPECPECRTGRGEQEYGAARPSLNRVMSFRRCTECRHEWAHGEIPNNSSKPMLDDDGRDTPGACVPFAISKACGLDFWEVLRVCKEHGWSESGMPPENAVVAARKLGFDLIPLQRLGIGSAAAPTLKRLLEELPANRNYTVGVKNHWLALVDGRIVDNDTNSGPGRKVLELYEVRKRDCNGKC